MAKYGSGACCRNFEGLAFHHGPEQMSAGIVVRHEFLESQDRSGEIAFFARGSEDLKAGFDD